MTKGVAGVQAKAKEASQSLSGLAATLSPTNSSHRGAT